MRCRNVSNKLYETNQIKRKTHSVIVDKSSNDFDSIIILVFLIVAWTFSIVGFSAAARIESPMWFDKNQNRLLQISSGEIHTYQLRLRKEQFISGNINQKDVDVSITIINPSGQKVGSFDQFDQEKEPFHLKTQESGIYYIQIESKGIKDGQYVIKLNSSLPIAILNKDKMRQMMVHYADDDAGGVIFVVQKGEVVFSQGYGLANIEYEIPFDVNTPFQLASASKPFTAFAIALLAENNKLSLDDDIRKYLLWMPDFGEIISIRHLLNHCSGLKDAFTLWEMSGGRHDDIFTQKQILQLIKNQNRLDFTPGQQYQYNNSGYALLAEIVSQVTKQEFNVWMKNNIFNPLNMKSTFVLDNYQQIIKNRAYSYESKYMGLKNTPSNKSYFGAVNVYSTAADLSKWLRNYHELNIGSQKIVANMWLPSASIFTKTKKKNYSMGVFIRQHKGLKQIQQGGTTANFRTMIKYYPEIDAGVIVLSNTPDFNVKSIAHKTAEIFFSSELKIENEKYIQTIIPGADIKRHKIIANNTIKLKQQKVNALTDYIGIYYSDELNATYKIDIENELLVVKYHRGVFPLYPKDKDRFGLNDDWLLDWDFIFERDDQGKIHGLKLDHSRAHNVQFKRVE